MTEASPTPGPGTRWAATSPAQDGLWFLDRLVPDAPAHTVCRAYRVTGDLDLGALRAAWREVVRRHEILRTVLVDLDGGPAQEIAADCDARSVVDLGDVGAGTQPERLCAELAATAVSLGDEPLARLIVARLGAAGHLVAFVLHQAVADDRSMSILAEELSGYYAAAVAGRPVRDALPAPARQYADYARWQRDLAASPELRRQQDWWTSALTPLPPALALPVDRARPAGPSGHGGAVRFEWGPDLGRGLAGLAATAGTSPYVVLLAAFGSLLHRYGGEDRLAVAVPATVRPGPEFEGVVGQFRNPLVLCADLSGRPSFREVLGRVARLAADAFDRRELPFDSLVRALRVHRDPRRLPLCDAMFVFPDAPEAELELAGTVVRRLPVHDGAARTDLTLTVERVEPSLTGSLEYRGSLFERESARLVVEQLRTLLAAALERPDTPVGALPLESADRIRDAVLAADQITPAARAGRSAHELVHLRARQRPAADAVSWAGAGVTYRELEERAASVTAALLALGGVGGRAVAVRMSPGPRQVAALLGVLDAGAHLVCLGAGDAGERGRAVLADLRPTCLVQDGAPADDELTAWYRAELAGRVVDLAALDGAGTAPPAAPPATPSAAPPATPPAAPPIPAGGGLGERAYVAYTSGSTGRPKGIAQSHGGFAQFVGWVAGRFGIGPGSRVAQWAAPGYDASLVEIFAALSAGATLCPVPDRIRANPEKIADWLATERITLFQTVPSFARELLKVIDARGSARSLAALEHLLLAGEALPGDLANDLRARLPAARLFNLYGPTESILATWHEITGAVHGTAPIGRSIPGRQVLVLDDEDRPCPAGVTGNIVIRSPYITLGYVGAASGDASGFRPLPGHAGSAIEPGGCYRTGDLGRRRWDGPLEFRGRRDFQVKLAGTRMELADIEASLAAHDSVADCVVVAPPDRDGLVSRVVAYVVPRRGPDGAEAAGAGVWRAYLRRRFGKTMLPVTFTTMTALPRNIGGKVDRRALPAPEPSLAENARPPQTPVEKGMAAIWSELLGAGQLGAGQFSAGQFSADDTFFAAGGHSLLVLQLASRVRARFGVDVPLWEYFANPTLAGLCDLVDSALRNKEVSRSTDHHLALPDSHSVRAPAA